MSKDQPAVLLHIDILGIILDFVLRSRLITGAGVMSCVMASIGTAHRHSGPARWRCVAELSSGEVRDGIGARRATGTVQTRKYRLVLAMTWPHYTHFCNEARGAGNCHREHRGTPRNATQIGGGREWDGIPRGTTGIRVANRLSFEKSSKLTSQPASLQAFL